MNPYPITLRRLLAALSAVMLLQAATAQNADPTALVRHELDLCPEKTGGVYYAYPAPDSTVKQAAPPTGYTPFYVSHYGRHGSRHLTADSRYKYLVNVFNRMDSEKQLTPLGKDVRTRLLRVWSEARGRGGSLTVVGERQHQGIALRIAQRCPQIFNSGAATVTAISSTVPRCILSMAAFCEKLKELNPNLNISKEASKRTMDIVAWNSAEVKALSADTTAWRKQWLSSCKRNIRPARLLSTLFKKDCLGDSALYFMEEMYALASDMQDIDIPQKPSFYDLFTPSELYEIWRSVNWRMYICNANAPAGRGAGPRSSASLLLDIVQKADSAVAKGVPAADLRFGHDTNLIRLLALMQAEGCAEAETDPSLFTAAWQDYNVAPMAANLQITFYRNTAGSVIVKLMLNERDIKLPLKSSNAPFYEWSDVRKLWANAAK